MAKDKKSSQANLIGRTAIYGVLSMWGLLGSLFLLYFGMVYTVITFSGLPFNGFQVFPALLGLTMLAAGFATLWLGFKNGRAIWKQWQRKKAISEEAQRVSRLIDEKAETESVFEEEISQEQKQRS